MKGKASPGRYARYGPTDRYDGPPSAGLCISVFAVARRRGGDGVLVGVPKKTARWRRDWLYSKEAPGPGIYAEWRLPSCYLKEGEHPEDALRRIMNEQLGIREFRVSSPARILSYYSPSDWYPGRRHWDLVVVYEAMVETQPAESVTARWWSALDFAKGDELRSRKFGWNSDLMRDLKLT